MLNLAFTSLFKKDVRRAKKQGKNLASLEQVLEILLREEPLPEKYHDHDLVGNYSGHRECHIEPDWLLIYRIDSSRITLTATRLGSHSEILDK